MDKRVFACMTVAALALAGCGKSGTESDPAAIGNVVRNTTSDLESTAGHIEDAAQANAVVNEEMTLMNVGNAAGNTTAP